MKVNSIYQKGCVMFDHYKVKKRGDKYYAVYDIYGYEITSGTSMGNACKKAKLLEIGYQQAMDIWREWEETL